MTQPRQPHVEITPAEAEMINAMFTYLHSDADSASVEGLQADDEEIVFEFTEDDGEVNRVTFDGEAWDALHEKIGGFVEAQE